MAAYSYKVRAHNRTQVSDYTESNKVVLGPPLEAPYHEYFNEPDHFLLYNVIDDNKDGYSWEFNPVDNMVYNRYCPYQGADDYLVTPPIQLKNDRKYVFSFGVTSGNPDYTEIISASLGEYKASIYSFKELVPPTSFSGESKFLRAVTSVENEATYTFALHASSIANQGFLYVDSIFVDEGCMFAAPDSVRNLTLTAGSQGAPDVTVRFKTPSQTVGGDALAAISKIEIFRDGVTDPVVFDAPATNTELTFVDKDMPNGFNTYSVVAYNDAGA